MLVDSHCHLDRLQLDNYANGIDDVLALANERGVERFLCVAIDQSNTPDVYDLATRFPSVYASAGVHPMAAHENPVSAEWLRDWGSRERVVALGETGLDYYYSEEHIALQQQSFRLHMELAVELNKPVIVHTRGARQDTISMLEEYSDKGLRGVLHCFTEDWDMAKKALDLGFYISISGIVTFRNADQLRDVVRKIPLQQLLVETDAPYLAPVPHRGKSNEPQWVYEVASYCAELKGVSFEELAAVTTANFDQLFLAHDDRRDSHGS
ncbi:MAG: TatD family hydrolase [Pseudomonadales bacterium]